eukprot:gene14054-23138_t
MILEENDCGGGNTVRIPALVAAENLDRSASFKTRTHSGWYNPVESHTLTTRSGASVAGKTLKIYDVKYSGACELPDTFVLKVPNYMMESIDWGKSIFTMCDLGFRQENHFYENCSDKHPLELPTMYWI